MRFAVENVSWLDHSDNAIEYYPSVDFGAISIARAREHLALRPTALRDALAETARFFDASWHRFPEQRNDALEDFSAEAKQLLERHYAQ